MLIEKKYKTNDIVVLKLISGEEIIGKVIGSSDNALKLKNIFTVVMFADPRTPGQGQVSFAPFMVSINNNEELEIEVSKVLTGGKADKGSSDMYKKVTSPISSANISDISELSNIDFSKFAR